MQVYIKLNNCDYLSYDGKEVLSNDSRLLTHDSTYTLSGKYYGSSTCLGESGWISYYDEEKNCLVDSKEIVLYLKVISNEEIILDHKCKLNIPEDYKISQMYFNVNDDVVKKIFIRYFLSNIVPRNLYKITA
jgi:hypothetical protein